MISLPSNETYTTEGLERTIKNLQNLQMTFNKVTDKID